MDKDSLLKELRKSQLKNEFYFSEKAGPGAYNLPPLIGNFTLLANKRNQPAYSMGNQDKSKVLIQCKTQADSTKGCDSPGVCRYNAEFLKLRLKGPTATIGREKRFMLQQTRDKLSYSIPH